MNAVAKAHILAAQLLAHNMEGVSIHEIVEAVERNRLIKRIYACAEKRSLRPYGESEAVEAEYVAIVFSGRDCDGVAYNGDVHYVRAELLAVEGRIDWYGAQADAPWHHYIARPSDAMTLAYESRDLTLEAFEDGHSHVIYA